MNVEEQVVKIVVEQLCVKESDVEQSSSLSDLGADSLDSIELCMALEEEFGVDIPDEMWDEVNLVSDCVAHIYGALKVKQNLHMVH